MLYVDCFGRGGVWSSHSDNAKARIADLQERIAKVDVPLRGWTDFEIQVLGGSVPPGSFASLLMHANEVPPHTTEACPSASVVRTLKPSADERNPVEEAALRFIEGLYPNIAELDVAAWPFEPLCVPLVIKGRFKYVLMVFRSNGKGSKVPRLFHTFGHLNLMAEINKKDADSNHPAYLGCLNWSNDRVMLFETSNVTYVRTWANGTKYNGQDRLTWHDPF